MTPQRRPAISAPPQQETVGAGRAGTVGVRAQTGPASIIICAIQRANRAAAPSRMKPLRESVVPSARANSQEVGIGRPPH